MAGEAFWRRVGVGPPSWACGHKRSVPTIDPETLEAITRNIYQNRPGNHKQQRIACDLLRAETAVTGESSRLSATLPRRLPCCADQRRICAPRERRVAIIAGRTRGRWLASLGGTYQGADPGPQLMSTSRSIYTILDLNKIYRVDPSRCSRVPSQRRPAVCTAARSPRFSRRTSGINDAVIAPHSSSR